MRMYTMQNSEFFRIIFLPILIFCNSPPNSLKISATEFLSYFQTISLWRRDNSNWIQIISTICGKHVCQLAVARRNFRCQLKTLTSYHTSMSSIYLKPEYSNEFNNRKKKQILLVSDIPAKYWCMQGLFPRRFNKSWLGTNGWAKEIVPNFVVKCIDKHKWLLRYAINKKETSAHENKWKALMSIRKIFFYTKSYETIKRNNLIFSILQEKEISCFHAVLIYQNIYRT